MHPLLEPETDNASEADTISPWRNPAAWLREQKLSRNFWIFFAAAFAFDLGFSIYYFLFNLYLLDLHLNEKAIGLVGGALALGSVVGTLPAGFVAKKIGVRSLLMVCFVAAPAMGALRAVAIGEHAQVILAFIAGISMCLWGVCFLPAVARLTSEKNRASAFSLIFSVSVGSSALGGIVCGYLPQWLHKAGFTPSAAEVKRLILLASCAVAASGLMAVLKLQLPSPQATAAEMENIPGSIGRWRWRVHPFLVRFLPAMMLWTGVMASFMPFANVYLSRALHLPLVRIGVIFSVAKIVQLCSGLVTPLLFRALGLVKGIVATQVLTAIALGSLAATQDPRLAVVLYLGFFAMQWMSSPGLYNLLMSGVPDSERSTASAMTLFCNAVVSAGATAIAGTLFTKFGYPRVLSGIAILTMMAAMLFRFFVPAGTTQASALETEVLVADS
jgi:MFS-type transporter involved in bile tolerance (Atg22 family)